MRIRTFALVVILLVFSLDAVAQVTTGTILGTVKDPSGAAIPGVQIVVTESSKGISKSFVTDGVAADDFDRWVDAGAMTAPRAP